MRVQYARFAARSAWLGNSFGEEYARKLFGDAAIEVLPRYTRGKNTGKLRGEIAWIRCVEGGWNGERVECHAGQTVFAILRDPDGGIIASYGDDRYSKLFAN